MGNDPRTAWRRFFERELRAEVQALASAYPAERSLAVDAIDLHAFDPQLADQLFTAPDAALSAAEAALHDLNPDFDRVRIRPENYPGLCSVQSLRSNRRSELVAVEGIVTSSNPIRSKVAVATFSCTACGERVARRPRGLEVRTPPECPGCETTGALSFDDRTSTFVDVQRVVLSDPGRAASTGGSGPWSVDVCLADDLVEAVGPDDSAIVTGILRIDGDPPVNRFDFLVEALALDTDVALGSTSDPTQDEAAVPASADDGVAGKDLKRVLESHWRDAVDADNDTRERPPATTGQA